jgi:hypothetical protein
MEMTSAFYDFRIMIAWGHKDPKGKKIVVSAGGGYNGNGICQQKGGSWKNLTSSSSAQAVEALLQPASRLGTEKG